MFAIVAVLLLLIIAPALAWALRSGGVGRVWLLCGLSLAAIVASVIGLSISFAVPSTGRVLLHALALLAPPVLFSATVLTLLSRSRGLGHALPAAYAASALGLAVGFLVVIYVLRVW